jgi:hypothetical protein
MSRFGAIGLALLAWFGTMAQPVVAASFVTVAPGVLSLKGKIDLGDCERWSAALAPETRTVLLNSVGGRDGQGECISRSIAAHHLRTVVIEKCSSICFLLFAAGEQRYVCQGGRVGVHRPHNADTEEETDDPKYLDAILAYARRYGVPDSIRAHIADTPTHSLYVLSPDDLSAMGVKDCN